MSFYCGDNQLQAILDYFTQLLVTCSRALLVMTTLVEISHVCNLPLLLFAFVVNITL